VSTSTAGQSYHGRYRHAGKAPVSPVSNFAPSTGPLSRVLRYVDISASHDRALDADVSLHVCWVMRQAARHGSGTFTSYRYISSRRTYNAICQVSACAGSQMRCGSSYGTCLRPRCSPVAVLNDRLPRMSYITASIRHHRTKLAFSPRLAHASPTRCPVATNAKLGLQQLMLASCARNFLTPSEDVFHARICRTSTAADKLAKAAAGMHGWLAVDVLISTPIKCLFRGDGTKKKKCGV
jgi:hypothetical protein